jgi:multidrug resistance efflux pump
MNDVFSRTFRALERQRVIPYWVLGCGVVMLAAWCAWATWSEVTLYATTSEARLEANQAVRPLTFDLSGRVSAVHVEVGQRVARDELLLELATEDLQNRIDQTEARRRALSTELEALTKRIAAVEAGALPHRAALRAAERQAAARQDEAAGNAEHTSRELMRATALLDAGAGSMQERDEIEARLRSARADVEIQSAASRQRASEALAAESDRRVLLEELREQAARTQGRLAETALELTRLQDQLGQHRIRAPVAGVVGELAGLQVGDAVEAHSRVGTIIPRAASVVVAYFPPDVAQGRLCRGQTANVRFDGFPWTEYGLLRTRVEEVAAEPRDGKIRVELAIEPGRPPPVALEHGLTGSVEVALERVTPAQLLLRLAGLVSRPLPGPPQPSRT